MVTQFSVIMLQCVVYASPFPLLDLPQRTDVDVSAMQALWNILYALFAIGQTRDRQRCHSIHNYGLPLHTTRMSAVQAVCNYLLYSRVDLAGPCQFPLSMHSHLVSERIPRHTVSQHLSWNA